ncbi:MAG: hypothetical protein LBR14_02330 [Clostridiales Family XIII bacterium]|nr:hypothetical protein [Clostridiales Family XIII bacterium]
MGATQENPIGSIDQHVLDASQSDEKTNDLIKDNLAYILSRVNRYAPGASADARENMFSVAQLAFYEAIRTYRVGKGHFYPFADLVIKRRIIDELRRNGKDFEATVSLDEENEDFDEAAPIRSASLKQHEQQSRSEMLAYEIEDFSAQLDKYGISFEMLVKNSPKHAALRQDYARIIDMARGDAEILETIFKKKYYPVGKIAERTKIPRKKVERSRIYVISMLIIVRGDFQYLSEYVPRMRNG